MTPNFKQLDLSVEHHKWKLLAEDKNQFLDDVQDDVRRLTGMILQFFAAYDNPFYPILREWSDSPVDHVRDEIRYKLFFELPWI